MKFNQFSHVKSNLRVTPIARIIQIESGEFEVSHVLRNRAGEIQEPKDEDFGVWAWTAYTLEKSEKIANDIESGERPIRSMEAQQ